MVPFIFSCTTVNLIFNDRNHISHCMGLGAWSEKLTIKGYEETSRGDGTALDLSTVVMVT